MSEKGPTPPNTSRRRMLQLTGGAIAAATAAAVGVSRYSSDNPSSQPSAENPIQPPSPTIVSPEAIKPTPTPDAKEAQRARLETAGLKDFIPIYDLLEEYRRTYGVIPRFMWVNTSGNQQFDLHSFLTEVAQKKSGPGQSEAMQLFNDGWNSKSAQLAQELDNKINNIEISDGGGGNEPDKIKSFLKQSSAAHPLLVMALPKKLRITPGGDARVVGDSLEMPSPNNREAAAASLLTEGQELLNYNWSDIKSFLSKEKYLKYLYTLTEQTKKVADAFYSQNWEDAQSFFTDSGMLPINPGNVPELEQKYANLLQTSKVPADKSNDLDYRYARVVHALGQKFYQISNQNKLIEELSEQDKAFYLDTDSRHWVNGCNLKILAGLKAFAKDKQNLLAKKESISLNPTITSARESVTKAKMDALSSISPNSTPLELRASMGLIYDKQSIFSKSEIEKSKVNVEQILGQKFAQIYEFAEQMQQKYRYSSANFLTPLETSLGSINLFEMLRAVGQFGKIPQTEEIIRALKEDWGPKSEEERNQAVENRINSFIIKDIQDRSPEPVRAFLRDFSNVFPYHILALPDNINTGNTGGAGGNYTNIHYPTNAEGAVVVLLHEGMHQVNGRWKNLKPFISQEAFLNFILKDLEMVGQTADAYFQSPWEQAKSFKTDTPLINFGGRDTHNISDIEKDYPDYKLDGMNDEDKKSDTLRRNRLMHYIGQTFYLFFKEGKSEASLTNNQKRLIENPDNIAFMQSVLGEIEHYFVGPVQKSDKLLGGLPMKSEQLPSPDSIFVKNNEQLQKARLAAFSTLPPEVSYSDLRKALKLPV
jgi:hypothetical protein